MAFGEPTSAPGAAEPRVGEPIAESPPVEPPTIEPGRPAEPRQSWNFDEDESWSAQPPSAPPFLSSRAVTTDPSTAAPTATQAQPIDPQSGESAVRGTPPGRPTVVTHPARMVLGLASLAAQRLRGGVPPGDAFATGVGLVQETAASLRDIGRRVIEPATRLAGTTVDRAVDRAATMPGSAIPMRSIAQSRVRLAKIMARARVRGEATVAAGRADAEAFVKSSVAETLTWAQAQAVPQIVDGLVPHLVDDVVPRLLEGALPEIRAKLLPVVIDDLAESPQLRELMLEQGRGVVSDAAEHVRTTTASADDRVESAFRRLVRGGNRDEPDEGPPPKDTATPPAEGG